jgi:flagellar biosynthesis/type III secretory pathway protein FliH
MTPETKAQLNQEIEAARKAGYEEGYAAAQRKYALATSDELNDIVNKMWLEARDFLQRRANEVGRPLHQGIPGLPDVMPLHRHEQ